MAERLRIAIAQLNLIVGDVSGNTTRVIEASIHARDELHADAVVFPELTLTSYPPEDLLLRPALHQQIENSLQRICADISGIDIIVGYPRDQNGHLYNSVALIRNGEIVAVYDKQNLPNYSVFDEERYFTAGEKSCVVEIAGIKVGLLLCEDVWQSGIERQCVDAGARLLISLNASPFHYDKFSQRVDIISQRVAKAGVAIVYANLVGGQDELVFDGDSFVIDAQGLVCHRLPAFEEAIQCCEFSLNDEGSVLAHGNAVAQETLPLEASVYKALVLGVRDYIEKNNFPGVVLGLSGGVDSALTLAIAVDAIGKDRVEAVMMPSRYTADMSLEDARAEAESLGVEYRQISIEPAFKALMECLADEFAGTEPDLSEENIQARCRGVILMAISNKKHKMVLTTGNKSEMSVGYSTLYGDMAGGYAPIKDVPKTLVYSLCRYRNSLSPVIPQRVLDRPPSAELAPDQKDADSLPPYDVLDPILEMYIEQDKSPAQIIACGYDVEVVQRVVTLVNRNEYKRRQASPGVRITTRAFGRDRRYPITSSYREEG